MRATDAGLVNFKTTLVESINDGRKELIKLLPDPPSTTWIVGGAVRDVLGGATVRKDVDLFFPDTKDAEAMEEAVIEAGGTVFSQSDRKTKYDLRGTMVDIIFEGFGDIENLLRQIDFTVATGAYDIREKHFYAHEWLLADLAQRQLRIQSLPKPLKTLNRVAKYAAIGYKLPYGESMRLGKHIREWQEDSNEAKMFEWED